MIDRLIAITIAVVVCYGLWIAVRPRWDIHIVVTEESVDFKRGVSQIKRAALGDFFRNDLRWTQRLVVMARKERSGRLVTRF